MLNNLLIQYNHNSKKVTLSQEMYKTLFCFHNFLRAKCVGGRRYRLQGSVRHDETCTGSFSGLNILSSQSQQVIMQIYFNSSKCTFQVLALYKDRGDMNPSELVC